MPCRGRTSRPSRTARVRSRGCAPARVSSLRPATPPRAFSSSNHSMERSWTGTRSPDTDRLDLWRRHECGKPERSRDAPPASPTCRRNDSARAEAPTDGRTEGGADGRADGRRGGGEEEGEELVGGRDRLPL